VHYQAASFGFGEEEGDGSDYDSGVLDAFSKLGNGGREVL
jgi:hypothetical protein